MNSQKIGHTIPLNGFSIIFYVHLHCTFSLKASNPPTCVNTVDRRSRQNFTWEGVSKPLIGTVYYWRWKKNQTISCVCCVKILLGFLKNDPRLYLFLISCASKSLSDACLEDVGEALHAEALQGTQRRAHTKPFSQIKNAVDWLRFTCCCVFRKNTNLAAFHHNTTSKCLNFAVHSTY